MILSGRDLQMYIEIGKLKIDPITSEQYQQNGVDMILERLDATSRGPSPFYLGCTRETVSLPDDLMAFVEIRSSWARRGFILPPTIVDAGFSGILTLEVLYFGSCGPLLPVGQRFAHLIFAKTSSPCVPYAGKYQHQQGITPAR